MINVALVGFGYWGPNIAKNIIASKKTNLYAICETSTVRLELARSMYMTSVKNFISDYKEILEDPNLDALAIAVPTEPSYQIALDAIAAGKHLFMEKPMTSTVKRAQELSRLSEEAGIIIHVDHIMVYNNIIEYIKKMIDNDVIGDLLYYDSSRMNLGPIRKDVNAMLDLAVHDLTVIDYLSDGKVPTMVNAAGGTGYGTHETLTYLTMKYERFLAHLKSSWISPIKERRIIIGGTKKMLIFDDVKTIDRLTIYDSGIEIAPTDIYGAYEFRVRTGDIHIPHLEFRDSLLASIEAFADSVNTGVQSITGPTQASRVIEILERAMQSMRN